ncbi:MAG: dTMP kinase [Rickettsiaceae bacterium]|nr:dTMP kinase [Rickettsiaceae bacterium]
MNPGKFITFEGGEGGGKSTQSKLLVESFQKSGYDIIHTREPGGTEGAESIRELLVTGEVNRWSPITETLLHLSARQDHITKLILPALQAGKHVISDRFSDSTMCYQGYGHMLGNGIINQLHNLTIGTFKPDLTIILDIAIDTGIDRAVKRRGLENRYERMDKSFHERVQNGFREIARQEPGRCVLIDASGTIKDIHKQIIDTANEKLGLGLSVV